MDNHLQEPADSGSIQERGGSQLDSKTRWSIYLLLMTCSLLVVSSRIWQAETVGKNGDAVPFFSANDRSRWCTIRSLGDHNTYAIDEVLNDDDGENWDTIDKVMHWGPDDKPHFYSSKPTLLSTLCTYPYIAMKYFKGWTLKNNTFDVVRWTLVISQVVPLFLFFWAVGRIAELVAEAEWTRIFLMACAGFGTYLTTFAISLNNHVPAAACVAVSLYAVILIWQRRSESVVWYFVAGLTAALAAAFDLPALAFLVSMFSMCLLRSVSKSVLAFVPAVILILLACYLTNKRAHDDWRTPYAHRHDGPVLTVIDGVDSKDLVAGNLPDGFLESIQVVRPDLNENSFENPRLLPGGWGLDKDKYSYRWVLYFDVKSEPVVLLERVDGFGIEVRQWNNWYEYPGSYWMSTNESKSRIDRGEREWSDYLAHLTVGSHGVFTLTPIWFLAVFGLPALCVSPQYRLRLLAWVILAISVTVITFYVLRPEVDRNYGGVCSAPRWLFWLIPLWMVAMIPALDAISEVKALRFGALLLLIISMLSAFYAWSNPWVHPWIYEVFYGVGI